MQNFNEADMKKTCKVGVVILFIIALLAFFALLPKTESAHAAIETTNTYISGMDVSYDISSNRSMKVVEDITISFDNRSGFIRYIPVNGGEIVADVKVYELDGTQEKDVYHEAVYDDDFLYLDIGDSEIKRNEYRTYRIYYTYSLTKAQEGKNILALTPIPTDTPCRVENIDLTFKLPKGYLTGETLAFVNSRDNSQYNFKYTEVANDGRYTLSAHLDSIDAGDEVRLDFSFESGSLTTYFDYIPYLFSLIGVALLLLLIILKLLVFNKQDLTPIVNYEAPNKMNPLLMGKLIDNAVDGEDISSLIYYWASKGYLKINLDNEKDPVLIRIMQKLPEGHASYENTMYDALFLRGDTVKISSLKDKFYGTVDKVKADVNKQVKGLYSKKTFALNLFFVAIAYLFCGFIPTIISVMRLGTVTDAALSASIAIVPIAVINCLSTSLMYYKNKIKPSSFKLAIAGIGLIAVLYALFYSVVLPNVFMSVPSALILCLTCEAVACLSVTLICRTKDYTEKLNDILGFKNFITLAEKDELEMMLEENPQFYYEILPYAQVLGVTDKWQEKFKTLTVGTPSWLATSNSLTVWDYVVINRAINHSVVRMSTTMIARATSKAVSGGIHAGFGGFSGGGHGGGGISFR
jgi:hypothetical protein